MNQDNLHPMNRSDFPQPDWNNPEWKPMAYPSKADCPNMDMGAGLPFGMTEAEFKQAEIEAMEEARRRWPTMADYFRHVYQDDLATSPALRKFEPRRITPPGGYASPKQAAASIYSTVSEVALKIKHERPIAPTEITALLLHYQILRAGVPIFYVSDDFIRAVAATDLPGDFTLDDLHWPMPAMVIGIPSKFSIELLGRDIGYIMAANMEEGDHEPPNWTTGLPTIKCPSKIGFQFHAYGDHCKLESFVTSWLKRDRVNEASEKYAYTDYTDGEHLKVESDRAMTVKVGVLLLKLLVVLNTRPGFVERGAITRPAKFNKRTGHKEQSELWSPNMIGFKFKPQRQEGGGTHASPHWHWRRGHITHQRIGSYRSPDFVSIASLPTIEDGVNKGEVDWFKVAPEVKAAFWRSHSRRWLEPILINFDEPEAPSTGKASA